MSEEEKIKKTPEDVNSESLIENMSENILSGESMESTETPSETQNTKLETENMEVHHHPHVEKKNFKEYLLEGLMIFLAVTMGFIAENIREHFVDKAREQQYIQSFYEDLSSDEKE